MNLLIAFLFMFWGSSLLAQSHHPSLVVFGDSFSDNGGTDGFGFNRYSNGDVWSDYLSRNLALTSTLNMAHGGAQTSEANYHGLDWSGLQWQVEQFIQLHRPLNQDIWAIFFIGYNDFFTAIETPHLEETRSLVPVKQGIANYQKAISRIMDEGIKKITVINIPSARFMPGFSAANDYGGHLEYMELLINEYNRAMSHMVGGQPGLNLVDAHSAFEMFVPQFSNISQPWNGSYERASNLSYLWWDEWHPMTDFHRMLAQLIERSHKVRAY